MLGPLIALLAPPHCLACRAPVGGGTPLCAACRRELPWLSPDPSAPAWAPLAFDGPARELVHALKFHGRTAAAKVMAAQIAANAPKGLLEGTIVPVPAHPRRKRERGFDQAHLIAKHLARRTHLPLTAPLTRQSAGGEQVGKGRAARLQRDLGIESRRPWTRGRAILLDDVHTTGATLRACTLALHEAGATDIAAVTYARTLG